MCQIRGLYQKNTKQPKKRENKKITSLFDLEVFLYGLTISGLGLSGEIKFSLGLSFPMIK